MWTSLWFLSLTLFLGFDIYIFELNILLSFFLWFCFAFQKEKRRFGIRISGVMVDPLDSLFKKKTER